MSLSVFLGMVMGSSASAQTPAETINYAYDALGRLTNVGHSGTVNNGVAATYQFDKAGNRSNVTVTGTASSAPSFAVSDASVTEGGTLAFTVTRTGTTSSTLTVNYATANGAAAAGSDYNAASGTLSFAPAETSKTVSVTTIDDAAVESAETMVLNLSAASGGATISDSQGVGTINDNDTGGGGGSPGAGVSFSTFSPTPAIEGGNVVFTVTKTGTATGSITLNYATSDITATAGSDYIPVSGTLTFAVGDTTKTITVPTAVDHVAESTEYFLLALTAASGGATLENPNALGVIIDNGTASLGTPANSPATRRDVAASSKLSGGARNGAVGSPSAPVQIGSADHTIVAPSSAGSSAAAAGKAG